MEAAAIIPVVIFGLWTFFFVVPRLMRQKDELQRGVQPIQQALAHRQQARDTEARATTLGVDIRELGLTKIGAGYSVKDWRGNIVVASLEDVLYNPNFFLLDERQEAYVSRWQQAHPAPDPDVDTGRGVLYS